MISTPIMRSTLRQDFIARLRGIVGQQFLVSSFQFPEGPKEPSTQVEKMETISEKLCGATPEITLAPGSADEVAAVLHVCSEEKIPIVPLGSGLQQSSGLSPQAPFVALQTDRLKETEHYDPGDLTVGVGAGTTLRQLDELIRPHQQWLPVLGFPERVGLGGATVGGMLAIAMHGPLKHAFGGAREFCIGVHFVTGDGKRGKGGGRVVKNVAGYDLMKLLIGSYGTLGVITSASFKLFPRPRQTVTFVSQFHSASEAIQFRDHLIASPLGPITLEIVSPNAARLLRGGTDPDGDWRIVVRAGGSDRQMSRYRMELGDAVTAELSGENEAAAWAAIEDFESKLPPNALLLSVICPISDVGQVISSAERAATERGLQLLCIGRAGIGSLVIALTGENAQTTSAVHSLRAALPPRVIITVRRAPAELRASISPWQIPSAELEIMRTLKNALDPAWILNRGRYFV